MSTHAAMLKGEFYEIDVLSLVSKVRLSILGQTIFLPSAGSFNSKRGIISTSCDLWGHADMFAPQAEAAGGVAAHIYLKPLYPLVLVQVNNCENSCPGAMLDGDLCSSFHRGFFWFSLLYFHQN